MAVLENNQTIQVELVLSPEGHVYLHEGALAKECLPLPVFEKLKSFFQKNSSVGLLHLGLQDFNVPLPESFQFWQFFSRKFVTQICKLSHSVENQEFSSIAVPNKEELEEVINRALLINGIEYLNTDVLTLIWDNLLHSLREELIEFSGPIQNYLKFYNPRWNMVGRVCFHLAENKKNPDRPFAFLATYTTHLSHQATPQHLPLKRALQDYSGEQNHAALLSLLLPVQKAAEQSGFIKKLVDSGSIFQAQSWSAKEAHHFLKEIHLMESSGVMVRVPNWWNPQKPTRPNVVVKLGDHQKGVMGLNTLLDFKIQLALNDGEELTSEEWQALLNTSDHFVKIKGTWVEVDSEKLKSVLAYWNKIQKASQNGLSMAESLRLLSGSDSPILADQDLSNAKTSAEWSTIIAGDWLKSTLEQLRAPHLSQNKSIEDTLKKHLLATLRPYQLSGVQWLWLLYQLKLGGCLADDMGLGKTIQVLSLLLLVKHLISAEDKEERKPSLLVVPASLLGNWIAEAAKFAPTLKILIAHSSAVQMKTLEEFSAEQLNQIDLVITTYGNVYRLDWLKKMGWNLIILDEAQFIKNPGSKQTVSVKELKGHVRLTLTGTPIENRLGDLWSLFDFTSPGLLGSSKEFSNYVKNAGKATNTEQYTRFISSLRGLTQPYILRRLKSDKKIISDLPDKTELQSYCSLSKEQIHLYQQAINELSNELETAEGIKRKGLVLSYLMRFKQICNHPSQWLGYGEYSKEASGKFIRLQEICEEIAAKQEKVLIFTQFKEVIPAISAFLTTIFGKEGLSLHGEIAVKKRAALVESFQQEQGPPFFVLSLKAGGTGLNLTRASHVIHFDRWWNPAVESQATDRAYRIGQKQPVLVHKFICRGTIEENIDMLIASKKNLSKDMLEGSEDFVFTEMTNEQLMNLFSLDIKKAMGDC